MNALPQPTEFPQYNWRPITMDDAAAMHRLSLANLETDRTESAQPVEEIQHLMTFLGDGLADDSLLALTAEGEIAALGLLLVPPESGEEHRAQINASVHVDHRGQGLGSFMTTWLEARARQRLTEFSDDRRRILQTGCRDHQTDRIQLLEDHGFQPVRYFFKMERDLSAPIPDLALVPELSLVNWTPELDEATRIALNDSFRDHFGFFPIDEKLWRGAFTGRPDFRGDLTFLAVDGDNRVIGLCLCHVSPERNAQSGKNEGVLADIGVIRGWRKRGIASAVIAPSLRAFKAAGLEIASLGVDTENPSGALRLYENLDFQAVERGITFQKVVA